MCGDQASEDCTVTLLLSQHTSIPVRHPKGCLLWGSRSRGEVPTESLPSGGRGGGEVWGPQKRWLLGGLVDSLVLEAKPSD